MNTEPCDENYRIIKPIKAIKNLVTCISINNDIPWWFMLAI